MRRPATDINTKQQKILDFIKESLRTNYRCPSVREIGNFMGLSSTSTVQSHLNTLEKFGYIKRDANKNRSITVVGMHEDDFDPVNTDPDHTLHSNAIERVSFHNSDQQMLLPSQLLGSTDCFLYRVTGDTMRNISMLEGDMLIVRKQLTANHGDIVIVTLGSETYVRRFYRDSSYARFEAEDASTAPIVTKEYTIHGRVIGLIRDHI